VRRMGAAAAAAAAPTAVQAVQPHVDIVAAVGEAVKGAIWDVSGSCAVFSPTDQGMYSACKSNSSTQAARQCSDTFPLHARLLTYVREIAAPKHAHAIHHCARVSSPTYLYTWPCVHPCCCSPNPCSKAILLVRHQKSSRQALHTTSAQQFSPHNTLSLPLSGLPPLLLPPKATMLLLLLLRCIAGQGRCMDEL
jgi:hypothetical protein